MCRKKYKWERRLRNIITKLAITIFICLSAILILIQYIAMFKRKSIQIYPQCILLAITNDYIDIDTLVGDNLHRILKEILLKIKYAQIDTDVYIFMERFGLTSTWKKTLLICFLLFIPGTIFLCIVYLILRYIFKLNFRIFKK